MSFDFIKGVFMRKVFFIMCLFMFVVPVFSQTYRYLIVKDEAGGRGSIAVLDTPEEVDSPEVIPCNNAYERYIAESGLRNVEDYYYRGLVSMMYLDASDTNKDPDIQFISSWTELLQYVRGEK